MIHMTKLLKETLDALNSGLSLFDKVTLGRLGSEGITLELVGGSPDSVYLDGARVQSVPLLFLAKSRCNEAAIGALGEILEYLRKNPPCGAVSAEITGCPALVDRGGDSFLYEAQVKLTMYIDD